MKQLGGTGIIGQDMVCGFSNDKKYLKKLPAYNIVLPNGVKDTVEKIDGKKTVVQRVGKCVLDGTQTYTLINMNQTKTTRVYVILDNAKTSKGNNNLICNWFIREGDHGDYEYIAIIPHYPDDPENAVFISVLNSKLETPDLNGMKKYFTENPLPFYYELENPVYTQI